MGRRKQTRGNCGYCGREMSKSGLTKHLKSCEARQQAIDEANSTKRTRQKIYHLQVADAWGGDYWLHLEIRGEAELEDLDGYLRAIWLECCGHLSAFTIGDTRYTQIFEGGFGWGDEEPMDIAAEEVFAVGMSIPYEYDFGTTSELVIKVVDVREGRPTTENPIALMARNAAPEFVCLECGKPATHICMQCLYEREDEQCELCDEHTAVHPHDDYGEPMPIVNSPRMGMCGYDGPAEPPY